MKYKREKKNRVKDNRSISDFAINVIICESNRYYQLIKWYLLRLWQRYKPF